MRSKLSRGLSVALLSGLLFSTGCSGQSPQGKGGPAGPPQGPPPQVEVAVVERRNVDATDQMVADIKAVETADIRSRVEGTLVDYTFREGSQVAKGQVLFQLDARPYQADVAAAQAQVSQAEGRQAQAEAGLSQARAALERARNQVNRLQVDAEVEEAKANLDAAEREVRRFRPLVDQGAVPQQRYDQVVDERDVAESRYLAVKARQKNTSVGDRADVDEASANVEAAQADVTAARAAVQNAVAALRAAELNLDYTTIRAPFSGVIGTLGVDPGSLVIPGQTRLATLSKNDTVYADFQVSEATYLKLAQGQGFDQAPFRMVLADDSTYQHPGSFVLVDRGVTGTTGTVTVRAKFPNPERLLKPGGFGRITMQTATLSQALVIPQKALTQLQSLDAVFVVKDDKTVEQRTITLGERLAEDVVVVKGLTAGERVVTEGLQKIRPGVTVEVAGKVS